MIRCGHHHLCVPLVRSSAELEEEEEEEDEKKNNNNITCGIIGRIGEQ